MTAVCLTGMVSVPIGMLGKPEHAWFVLQVAPRCENRVGLLLEHKGYEQFSPEYLSRQRWSDRIKVLQKPLFPGYVFVRTARTDPTGLICSTSGVSRILSVDGRPSSVPDSEIDAIRRLSALGNPIPTPYFNVGQQVEIREGPFAGIVGIVKQLNDQASFIVSVQLIAQSVCINVDGLHVVPVTDPAPTFREGEAKVRRSVIAVQMSAGKRD